MRGVLSDILALYWPEGDVTAPLQSHSQGLYEHQAGRDTNPFPIRPYTRHRCTEMKETGDLVGGWSVTHTPKDCTIGLPVRDHVHCSYSYSKIKFEAKYNWMKKIEFLLSVSACIIQFRQLARLL